jgi:hypothetical protein
MGIKNINNSKTVVDDPSNPILSALGDILAGMEERLQTIMDLKFERYKHELGVIIEELVKKACVEIRQDWDPIKWLAEVQNILTSMPVPSVQVTVPPYETESDITYDDYGRPVKVRKSQKVIDQPKIFDTTSPPSLFE